MPPGIYPKHLARYLNTSARKVEEVCGELGIERWSLGLLGRKGESVPLSLEQASRVLQTIRTRQGDSFLRQRRLR